jgi:hypothetical protein
MDIGGEAMNPTKAAEAATLSRTALFRLLLLPLVALGCSGGGGGSPQMVSDFCKDYADAVCQIAVGCGVTMDTCTAYQTTVCTGLATKATASPSKRVFTPANTGACISKLKSAYGGTSPVITPAVQAGIDLACGYVFQGPGVKDMDTCTSQFDCAGATNGSIICDETRHLCAQSMTISGTGQCSANGAVCSTNFYCATNTAGVSTCTAAGTATSNPPSPCSATVPCDTNSRCVSGACAALVPAGGACTADSDCANDGYCDAFGGSATCDIGIQFAKGSQQCTCKTSGTGCPSLPGGGGAGGSSGAAGAAGNAGSAGAGGHAGGAGAGAAGASGAAGAAGTAGAAGAAAGGHAGGGGAGGA